MNQNAANSRVRAWMVIRGKFDQGQATQIMALDQGRNEYVIVRVDLVNSLGDRGSGMVIPIDAMQGADNRYEYLYQARDGIAEILSFDPSNFEAYDLHEVTLANLGRPPQSASGYITIEEAHAAIDIGENGGKPGRQDHSPGFNPWG